VASATVEGLGRGEAWSALEDLLAEQAQVATRAQLRSVGVSDSHLRAELAARRWRELNDQVISTHNGPLTSEQRRWAVGLSALGLWAMCGLTAVEIGGVRGFETLTVHILVRSGAHVLPVLGVRVLVHESRRFEADDVVIRNAMPATTLARAAVDAAVWSDDIGLAHRIFVAPVQQRLEKPDRMLTKLLNAGRVRHRRVLLALANDLCGGAQALSEVEFLRFCRRHRLPRPKCQHREDSQGRRRYLDASFELPDGRLVRVEVDGGIHLSLATRWTDTAKDNDAMLDRRLVLRFPSIAIYTDNPRAVAQLRRALGTCQGHMSL
jgi:hypothetical protein